MRLLSLVAALGLLALAAVPVFAEKPSSDDVIHDKVMQKLASDREVKGGGIDVEVKDGVVTLRGTVREDRQKAKAEHLARKVAGVKSVDNQLVVEMGARPAPAKPSN